MKSKLKAFTALMVNGQHAFFDGKYGRMYKFTVEFENGDRGIAMSPKQAPNWKAGEEYTYERVDTQYGTNIKSMKLANSGGYPKKRDPETSKRIMNQSCVYAANEVMTMIDEEYKDVYNAFRDYVYRQTFVNNVDEIQAQFSIKAAADYYSKSAIESCTIEQVIKLAEHYVKLTNDTTWKHPQTSSPASSTQTEPPKASQPSQSAPPSDTPFAV